MALESPPPGYPSIYGLFWKMQISTERYLCFSEVPLIISVMLGCFEKFSCLHLCAAIFFWYSGRLNSVLLHGKNKYYLVGCTIFPMVQELHNSKQHSPTAPDLRSWLSAQTEPKALSSGGLSQQEGTWECISANKAAGSRESPAHFEGMRCCTEAV